MTKRQAIKTLRRYSLGPAMKVFLDRIDSGEDAKTVYDEAMWFLGHGCGVSG